MAPPRGDNLTSGPESRTDPPQPDATTRTRTAHAVHTLRTRLPALLTSRTARIIGTVGGLGLFALLIVELRGQWQENPPPLDEASIPLCIAAFVATAASVVIMLQPWSLDVRAVNVTAPRGLLSASLVGQLGKYVPGGIWPLLGRVGLASRLGVPLRVGSTGLAIEMVMIVGTSAVFAPLALIAGPTPVGVAVAIGLVVLAGGLIATRIGAVQRAVRAVLSRAVGSVAPTIDLRPLRRAAAYYLMGWVVTGAAFWLTANAIFGTPVADLPLLAGAYAVAWIVGFLIVIAPGGLGVRELVLVALLRPSMGEAEALLLAATSRIAFTAGDLLLAVAAFPTLRRELRRAATLRRAPAT